jgi:hypothetical protein
MNIEAAREDGPSALPSTKPKFVQSKSVEPLALHPPPAVQPTPL